VLVTWLCGRHQRNPVMTLGNRVTGISVCNVLGENMRTEFEVENGFR